MHAPGADDSADQNPDDPENMIWIRSGQNYSAPQGGYNTGSIPTQSAPQSVPDRKSGPVWLIPIAVVMLLILALLILWLIFLS